MSEFELSTKPERKRKGWQPDPVYQRFLAIAVSNIKETSRHGEPIYTKEWLESNKDLILEAFTYGYSSKTVAGVLGVPWHVWVKWTTNHEEFEQFLAMAESLQLMSFEQMRNEQSRGELRGSATSTLAVIDRLHSDQYFGKPGQTKDITALDPESEMTLEEAEAILEEAGLGDGSL